MSRNAGRSACATRSADAVRAWRSTGVSNVSTVSSERACPAPPSVTIGVPPTPSEQTRIGHAGVQPRCVCGRCEDHRHSIVHWLDGLVGRGREDRAGLEHLTVGSGAPVPEPCEGEQAAIGALNVKRLLGLPQLLPLVEPGCRHETPSAVEGPQKLFLHRLRARVDQRALPVPPRRRESPASHDQTPVAALGRDADDRDVLGRRDVVPRCDRDRVGQRKDLDDLLACRLQAVASTHGGEW